jgi:tetraacyldisaccharide 4'-kinase
VRARRWWGWPLVPLYWAVVRVKDGLRTTGVLRVRRLEWPVVSVGSLSAGGAGKTPVVIALAELLKERGWVVDVLSRGYGRKRSERPHDNLAARGDHGAPGVERVDLDVADTAERFGDEPVLIAQRTGVPVWVGAERFAAGVRAEAGGAARGVHLLDDGFQHRRLARAVDVVVVTAEDLEDALLPAGNRREGLKALRRADAVVVREEERERVVPRLAGLLRVGVAVWTVRRAIGFPEAAEVLHREYGLIAFCAIARPENFVEMLRAEGGRVVDSIAFPDHHRYTAEDMVRLTDALHASDCDGFITTEKDAVKFTPELRAQLEAAAPLLVARLQAAFVDADEVVRVVEAKIS